MFGWGSWCNHWQQSQLFIDANFEVWLNFTQEIWWRLSWRTTRAIASFGPPMAPLTKTRTQAAGWTTPGRTTASRWFFSRCLGCSGIHHTTTKTNTKTGEADPQQCGQQLRAPRGEKLQDFNRPLDSAESCPHPGVSKSCCGDLTMPYYAFKINIFKMNTQNFSYWLEAW